MYVCAQVVCAHALRSGKCEALRVLWILVRLRLMGCLVKAAESMCHAKASVSVSSCNISKP